jgi:hypothetical protein
MRGSGSAIGSGNGAIQSRLYSLTITGGGFVLHGSRGVGCDSLILGNSSFDCSGISSTSCLRGQNVTFTSGPLIVRTPQSNFIEFDRVLFSGNPELRIEYLSTSVRENLVGLPIIHIGQLEFPVSSIYDLYISSSAETNPNCHPSFTIDSSRIRGIGFSVPSLGGYTISYSSLSTLETGYLVHNTSASFDALFDNDTFYSTPVPSTTQPASPTPTDEFTSDVVRMSHRKRIIIRFSRMTFPFRDL